MRCGINGIQETLTNYGHGPQNGAPHLQHLILAFAFFIVVQGHEICPCSDEARDILEAHALQEPLKPEKQGSSEPGKLLTSKGHTQA
jgi:hypothetical protein